MVSPCSRGGVKVSLVELEVPTWNLRAATSKLGTRQELETGLEGSDVESDVLILQTCALESLLCTGDFQTPSLGLRHEPRVTASPALGESDVERPMF